MKILFTLTPAFDPNYGGVQQTTFKLGKYFTEQGLEVYYYSLAFSGHKKTEYGQLFKAPEKGSNHNPVNIADLKRVIEKVKPDIVINQMPYEKELRELLAFQKITTGFKLLGCLRNSLFNFKSNVRNIMQQILPIFVFKLMDNFFGIGILQMRHYWRHRKDLKAIIDQHDYFVLLAPPNQEELNYFIGDYKTEKVVTIPNSIPKVYDELVEKEKIILHVGRLNVIQKRSDLLLDFWEKLYPQLPDWKFVIVGDGPYYSKLDADLKKRALPRIELAGYQKPEKYFQRAPIFMMPSAYEGFPNTIIEAQSFGCAPLAFNSYATIKWIVNDCEDALLSRPFDIQQMADHAVTLASSPKTLCVVQQKALQNAARFTIDRVGRQWLDFFDQIIK